MIGRRRILAFAALLGVATAAGRPGLAEENYPARTIQMVIPTGAGGGTDISLRMLASLVEPILGQKIVVLNKPGGGGAVGMEAIVLAKPDGYTIGGLWNAPLTMTLHIFKVRYNTDSYTAVSLSTWAPAVFCVKPDFPAKDGESFLAELKKKPGKYTYGNDGVGGTLHLAAERIFAAKGVTARPIPFTGAGETLKTFLGGDIDIYAGSISPILPFVKDGSAKCLLLTSADRLALLPQASGLKELGIPEDETVLWRGIIAPNNLPPDRLAKLQDAFAKAAHDPKFEEFLRVRGEEARGSDGATMRKLIDSEYDALGKVIAKLGLAKS